MKKAIIFFCLIFIIGFHFCFANNIAVSSIVLRGRNTTAGVNHVDNFAMVQFNLSWENSWRWSSSTTGRIVFIGVKEAGTLYASAPNVYLGSQGSVSWQANTAVTAGQLLSVTATPTRYYIVTSNTTTLATAPTHTSGTTNSLQFVTITDGGGSGATATASVTSGAINGFTITNSGSGYTSIPTLTIAPTNGGSGASADVHIRSWWDAAWVFVKFQVGASDPSFSSVTLTNGSTTVSLSSVTNLRVGMPVRVTAGSSTIPAGTVITAINTATNQITLSAAIGTATASNNTLQFTRIWEHAQLNGTGHFAIPGSVINTGLLTPGSAFNASSNPGLGAFVYRSTNGSGNNTFNNLQLRWNYGRNGVRDDAVVNVRVFAIEMVYVPQGSFTVGGTTQYNSRYVQGSNLLPVTITSATNRPTWFQNNGGTNPVAINCTNDLYPTGFNPFYCMKTSVSQQMYCDFLNTLTRTQQAARIRTVINDQDNSVSVPFVMCNQNTGGSGSDYWKNYIRISTITAFEPMNFFCDKNQNASAGDAEDNQFAENNFVISTDCSAFLDWASLRPMSDLEFEKACRGNQAVVANELAHGVVDGATSGPRISAITNLFRLDERPTGAIHLIPNGSAYGFGLYGPVRVGSFAKTNNANRSGSGASFYGILDLSGGLMEMTIPLRNIPGCSYRPLHGNGQLLSNGFADMSYWPGINDNSNTDNNVPLTEFTGIGNTGFAGWGQRGGVWTDTSVPDRLMASSLDRTTARPGQIFGQGIQYQGFRGVRSE